MPKRHRTPPSKRTSELRRPLDTKADKKLRRNEPCWCGSGQKYKRCHLDRDKAPPVSRQERSQAFQKSFGTGYCLHPNPTKEIVAVTLLKPIPFKEVVASTKSPGRAKSTIAYCTGRSSLLTKNPKNQFLLGLNKLRHSPDSAHVMII
jgi:hypothetical protein